MIEPAGLKTLTGVRNREKTLFSYFFKNYDEWRAWLVIAKQYTGKHQNILEIDTSYFYFYDSLPFFEFHMQGSHKIFKLCKATFKYWW